MSIASDFRSYADSAVAQGKQVIDTAQAQLNDVTGTANDYASTFADKASETVNELRVTAEKAINLDAIKNAVEPYLAQAKQYGTTVTDRAEDVYNTVYSNLRSDKRVAKVFDSASAVSELMFEQVNDRIVKPVQSLTGIGVKPAAPARKPAPKPAATKPATARKSTARPAAKKAPARKTAAKRTPKA